MYFVGIDLAWSEKNNTGISILKGNKKRAEVVYSSIVGSDEEILKIIKSKIDNENALIAIDAPLIVPNEEGRRLAEALVGNLFRRYNAGAHPANRKRLSQWSGTIRGEELSKILEKSGFRHDPYIKKFEDSRKFFEVYPHPSTVVLFKLDKILQYKNKPNRDYPFRYNEFKKYKTYLENLKNPELILPNEIININVEELKAKKLKNYEDILDSIFCAYIAYYSWVNPERCSVLGNMKQGYIMTPVFDSKI